MDLSKLVIRPTGPTNAGIPNQFYEPHFMGQLESDAIKHVRPTSAGYNYPPNENVMPVTPASATALGPVQNPSWANIWLKNLLQRPMMPNVNY